MICEIRNHSFEQNLLSDEPAQISSREMDDLIAEDLSTR
jgi:hypothetical protein